MTNSKELGAVLIDLENLYLAIRDEHRNPVETTETIIENLKALLEEEHEIHPVVMNAYAPFDFETTRQLINGLSLLGIKLEHVLSKPQKNSADLLLAIDCTELLYRRDDIRHFVIVGGDRDYIPVAQRIMTNAREVLIVCPRHAMSGDLLAIVGRERYLDTSELIRSGPELETERPEAARRPPAGETAARQQDRSSRQFRPDVRPASEAPRVRRAAPPATLEELRERVGDQIEMENQERLMRLILEFRERMGVQEIYLAPFFREMNEAFPYMSNSQRKALLNSLQLHGAIDIVDRERNDGEGTYAVIVIDNWTHPLVLACVPG
ncbi:MAG: NYN domain-containing protein [Polyangia bacterium]